MASYWCLSLCVSSYHPASSIQHLASLKISNLMLIRSNVDRVVDPLDHVAAVAGEQRSDVDVALLQLFVWIKLIEGALQLPMRSFIARHLGPVKARAQPFELIVDFA